MCMQCGLAVMPSTHRACKLCFCNSVADIHRKAIAYSHRPPGRNALNASNVYTVLSNLAISTV